ncbi:MAG: hypothetical protein ACP5OA_00800 [Candidatus Woesearchaeota archaeon]
MDKVLRNVIIFSSVILLVAAAAVVISVSKDKSDNPSVNTATDSGLVTGEFQNVKLSVSGGTYVLTPSVLKKDIPVRMEADLATLRGCSRDVVISAFGVRKYLKEGDNIITFTPTKTGIINIACSMNMYRGTFTVTDSEMATAATNVQGLSVNEGSVQSNTQTTLSEETVPTHKCGMSNEGCGCGSLSESCGCGG